MQHKKLRNSILFTRGLKNKSGFTLVELMVTIVIMGIVLTVIYNILLFGMGVLNTSQKNSQEQYEVRMATDYITKQLRYANSITFLTSEPLSSPGYNDIYTKDESGIKYLKVRQNGLTEIPPGLSEFQNVKLVFNSFDNDKGILEFTIGSTMDSKYDIKTKVILLNYNNSIVITISDPCIGLRYELPD